MDIQKLKERIPNDKKTIIYVVLFISVIAAGWYLFSGRADVSDVSSGINSVAERLDRAKTANDAAANGVERVQGQLSEYGNEAGRMATESGSIAAGLQDARKQTESVRTGLGVSSGKLSNIQQIIDRDISILRTVQERGPTTQKED